MAVVVEEVDTGEEAEEVDTGEEAEEVDTGEDIVNGTGEARTIPVPRDLSLSITDLRITGQSLGLNIAANNPNNTRG